MYREVGEWAKDKHFYFEKYLKAFLVATKRAKKKYYIDMFAGPGECIIRDSSEIIPGSPRIALSAEGRFDGYFFIELDEPYCQELEKLKTEFPDKTITIFNGDCNGEVCKALDAIEKTSPTLVFIDPTKEDYKWETIETLAKHQTDLFLNLPFYMSTRRLLTHRGDVFARERIAEFFGPLDWELLYERMMKGEKVSMADYLMLYQEGLRGLGFTRTSDNAATIKNVTGQPLYYLILASKHPAGQKIFDDILKVRPDGQRSLNL